MWCFVSLCSVVSTSAVNCLERLVSKMTYFVSSRTLSPTHSLTPGNVVFLCTECMALTTAPIYSVVSVLNLCAAQFFCCVAMVTYAVDVFLQALDIRRKYRECQPPESQGVSVPVVE